MNGDSQSGEPDDCPQQHVLSRREIDVLECVARGLLDKQTAERLGVSLGSVREYRGRIQRKLGIRGCAPTLLVAWKLGLIDLDAIADEAMARTEPRGTGAP